MPLSAVARLNAITYAGLKVGAGTVYHLHGVMTIARSYQALLVRFLVICHDPDEALFIAQATALEDAYRTVNGDLKIEVGGSTPYDLTHDGNTGMLGAPLIQKPGSSLDSNNTRLYSCAVTVQLPADEAGKAGRQVSRVVYSSDGAEIVRVSLSAAYTALGASGALAQAKSDFPSYVAAKQLIEGGTWDEEDRISYAVDGDDKICQASASYVQVIANQSSGTLNDSTLQGVRISIVARTPTSGRDPKSGARDLQTVTVRFGCRVRRSASTDLKSVFESKVRPRMIELAKSLSGNSRLSAIDIRPGFNPDSNSIQAQMTLVGIQTNVIRSEITTSKSEDLGFYFERVLTGGKYDRDRHEITGTRVAGVVATVLEVDTGGDRALLGFRTAIRTLEQDGFHLRKISTIVDKSSETDGLGVTPPLRLRLRKVQAILEFANVQRDRGGISLVRRR